MTDFIEEILLDFHNGGHHFIVCKRLGVAVPEDADGSDARSTDSLPYVGYCDNVQSVTGTRPDLVAKGLLVKHVKSERPHLYAGRRGKEGKLYDFAAERNKRL